MTSPREFESASHEHSPQPVCPRHPDQVAYVNCQRCERPACPQCWSPAPVGVQCVDCSKAQAESAPVLKTVFGASVAEGRPVVTIGIIAVCAVLFLAQLASGWFTDALMYAPALGRFEPWRFLTAAFVHSPTAITHILFNMYALWICGSYLEPLLGRVRFAALYLLAAVGGSVGYLTYAALVSPGRSGSAWWTPTVGASGAVFGLFLAVVVFNRSLGRSSGPMLAMIVINAVLPLFVPNIAWQAHLGGAITGGAAALTITKLGRERAKHQWWGLAAVLAAVLVLAVAMDAIGTRQVADLIIRR